MWHDSLTLAQVWSFGAAQLSPRPTQQGLRPAAEYVLSQCIGYEKETLVPVATTDQRIWTSSIDPPLDPLEIQIFSRFDRIFRGKALNPIFGDWDEGTWNLGFPSYISIVIFDAEPVYLKLQLTNYIITRLEKLQKP